MVKIKSANHLKNGYAANVHVIAFDDRLKPLEEDLKERLQDLDCNKLEFCHFNELKRKFVCQGNINVNTSTNNIVQERTGHISIDFHQENDHQLEDLKLSQTEFLQLKKEQFKSELEYIANGLNNCGNKSILLIDELPLHLESALR